MRQNYILLGIVLGLLSWIGESFIHWYADGGKMFELVPSDTNELWMRILIFSLLAGFGVYADYHTKSMIARESETRKIFRATASASQHILNNFLNEILFFRDEAQRTGGVDDETLKLLDKAVSNASGKINSLHNVSDISVENIKVSVRPENNE